MILLNVIVLSFFGIFELCEGVNPPKTWNLCSKKDPKVNECLRKAVEDAIHGLKDGNSKLGLLPLDPLRLNSLVVDQSGGSVAIVLKLKDIDIYGISTALIDRFSADWDNVHLEADTHFANPHYITALGQYEIDGKVLMLPIKGSGRVNLTLDNFSAKVIFDGKEFEKNGEKYLDVDKVKVDIGTTRLHMDFENLFNGDKALGQQMNVFLNENWSDILTELRPAIEKSILAAVQQIANTIFHKVPINKITLP